MDSLLPPFQITFHSVVRRAMDKKDTFFESNRQHCAATLRVLFGTSNRRATSSLMTLQRRGKIVPSVWWPRSDGCHFVRMSFVFYDVHDSRSLQEAARNRQILETFDMFAALSFCMVDVKLAGFFPCPACLFRLSDPLRMAESRHHGFKINP